MARRALPAALWAGLSAAVGATIVELDRLPWAEGGFGAGGCTWLIEYFHPQCGGCRALAGPFRTAAHRARQERLACVIGSIDCETYEQYCTAQGAAEFPLLQVWSAADGYAAPSMIPIDDLLEEDALAHKLWDDVSVHCRPPPGPDGAGARASPTCTQDAVLGGGLDFHNGFAGLQGDGQGGGAGDDNDDDAVDVDPHINRERVWGADLLNALRFVLLAPVVDANAPTGGRAGEGFLALAREAYPSASVRAVLAQHASPREAAHALPVQRSAHPWRGCSGSAAKYRGLPCALWQLFHTLTLRCAVTPCSANALVAIHAWVVERFNCRVCRHHFSLASRGWALDAMPPRARAMLLWTFHNDVNARLAGDPTDDPKCPKQRFPSETACPTCWVKDFNDPTRKVANEDAVFEHLAGFYSAREDMVEGGGDGVAADDGSGADGLAALADRLSFVPFLTGLVSLALLVRAVQRYSFRCYQWTNTKHWVRGASEWVDASPSGSPSRATSVATSLGVGDDMV